MNQKRNKRGWIEIVEAFIAILLIAGVVLVLLNKSSSNPDISQQVYTIELSILREIETTDLFRTEIIAIPELELPINVPEDVQLKIDSRAPNYLACKGRVCAVSDKECSLPQEILQSQAQKKDIYAQSVLITSTLKEVGYKQLKLFCWNKQS